MSWVQTTPNGAQTTLSSVSIPQTRPHPSSNSLISSFLYVTGPNATIRLVASKPGWAFAHEAPIYVPDLNVVFFASASGGSLGHSGWYNNSVVSMLNMTEVDNALAATTGGINIQIQTLNLSDTVQMVNGGTGPYKGRLLFVTSGRALLPPSVVLVNPSPPYNTTVLLDNYFGRQPCASSPLTLETSKADIRMCIASIRRLVKFTLSPTNSYNQMASPLPLMVKLPSSIILQINPQVRHRPSRWFFGKQSDVSRYNASFPWTRLLPVVLTLHYNSYQYDVDPVTQSFENRRVFAYSDSGIPDGIQLDTNGNIFSGCGDGIHVWDPKGTLIGKFFLNSTAPEMIFTKSGLLIFNDEMIYLANIQAQGIDLVAY
ncbi:hypothetical protein J3R82DRAFT_7650 [Butyriboletus roseoflavus]|nr:hypothetical protein J3R82DRAFT_7650 [Butyriboletus roseoflavus]